MKAGLAELWRLLPFSKKIQLFLMRFFQDQFLIGVTGIIFNDKNEVLVVKHSYRKIQWSLPGGYIKAGEHPKEGLAREIEEETGFIVSADKRMKIRTDRETARLDICYIGKYLGGTFTPSAEVTEAKFCNFEDLPIILPDQVIFIQQAYNKRNAQTAPPENTSNLILKFRKYFPLLKK